MTTILGAAAVFLVLMVVLRVMGKRELSQMTAFELVMLFVIGDIVGESVVAEDTSLVGALIATATFAVLTVLFSWISYRWAPPPDRWSTGCRASSSSTARRTSG